MNKKGEKQSKRVNATSPVSSTPSGGFVTMSEADREILLKRMKRFGLQ